MRIEYFADRGIKRVRQQSWENPHAYLRMEFTRWGGRGPWVHYYDRAMQESVGYEIPQSILMMQFPEDGPEDFEEYEGPLDINDPEFGQLAG